MTSTGLLSGWIRTVRKETWTLSCGAGVEPTIYRKKTEGGVNMDVVKLPKKVRMVCYEIMDGKEEALDTLESFADKYPHQVAELSPLCETVLTTAI